MNKKANTILFILGATLFNIVVTVLSFIVLLLLYIKFIAAILPETGQAWGVPLLLIASIAVSFLVYRAVLKVLLKKIPAERYFDPIFGRRRK
jgi:cbb3-type cytochrome oxidase subunit 3